MTPTQSAGLEGAHPFGKRALGAGIGGLALCASGAIFAPAQFFRSYLFAYLFWLGITLGCLGILMLQHLTGGAWGLVIRRLLESATRTLPVLGLLFLPLLPGIRLLYPWARPEALAGDEILRQKAAYLNIPFFLVRAAIYFVAWGTLAWLLNRWSDEQDRTGDPAIIRRLANLCAPGLVVYILTVTFASIDWMMSLEPHWFSTIYGGLVVTGQALAALAFAIVALVLLSRHEPFASAVSARHYHDLGKLLLAFIMVWSYFAFSQFLIIWAGNLPEEIPWYLRRLRGGWEWVALSLVVVQFAAPFLILLSRDLKRSAGVLGRVAGLVLAMRLVDLYWMTAPAFSPGAFTVHWMDLAAPIGIGGVWLTAFARQVRRTPLLPLHDPYLAAALAPVGHHEQS